jgi:hypothetical protein
MLVYHSVVSGFPVVKVTDYTIAMSSLTDYSIAMSPLADYTIAVSSLADFTIAISSLTDYTIAMSSLTDYTIAMLSLTDYTIAVTSLCRLHYRRIVTLPTTLSQCQFTSILLHTALDLAASCSAFLLLRPAGRHLVVPALRLLFEDHIFRCPRRVSHVNY